MTSDAASKTLSLARAWRDGDPDPKTRAELAALMEQGAAAALADRVSTRLEFGTAGLRGTLGAGPNRMNRALVRKATLGLCRYLVAQQTGVRTRGIVVGRDGRHMSPEFLEDTCAVIAGQGIPVHVFEGYTATPMVAYAVKALNAAAGVMITASHNPPEYNGYKVYWGNGAQIIPPHDTGIAAEIDGAGPASGIALASREQAPALWRSVPASVEDRYFEELKGLQLHPGKGRDLSIAYTPMHGVGLKFARRALANAGFSRFEVVAAQAEPDGDFPTVNFPNPEEPGAMDRLLLLGESMKADIAIANDPDADRLAVAARDGSGKLVALSGNEIGVLLGHYVLTEAPRDANTLVVTTLVSSTQLGVIARALGVRYEETLTGFKWIANRALALEPSGARFAMGYEEALGYTVGTVARDKDGVGAAVVLAELAALCKTQGKSLFDKLADIQREFGLFAASQKSITLPGSDGAAQIAAMMTRLRASPPSRIGDRKVLALRDVQAGTRTEGGVTTKLTLPPSNVLVFELEGDARIVARPSGTEPKIKFYLELKEQVGAGESMATARTRAYAALAVLQAAFLKLVQ